MASFEICQLNIAHLRAPIDSDPLREFVANLDRINELAEAAPGFVWRLQTEDGDATAIRDFGDEYIVNMSVWRDVASLEDFIFRSEHAGIMRRRKEWFHRMTQPYSALWWVEAGHRPDTSEARTKLDLLRRDGPTSEAFSLSKPFPPPGS